MRRLLHDPLLNNPFGEKTDAVYKLFQQLKVDEDIEPAAGFYSRVLDEISGKRLSVWFLLAHISLKFRVAVISMLLAFSALLFFAPSQRAEVTDYRSAISDLNSTHPEDRRDAVLALLLADPPLSSQGR